MNSQPVMSPLLLVLELGGIFFFWLYVRYFLFKEKLTYLHLPIAVFPGTLAGYGAAVLLQAPESFFDFSLLSGRSWQSAVLLINSRLAVIMLVLVAGDVAFRLARSLLRR